MGMILAFPPNPAIFASAWRDGAPLSQEPLGATIKFIKFVTFHAGSKGAKRSPRRRQSTAIARTV